MADRERHACKDCEVCGCECAEECVTPWPCPCADAEVEERPDDDPAPVATCNGRDCGGRPHE